MSFLQLAYLLSSLLFLSYLLWAKRPFDVFTVSGVSAALFMSPLYFGVVSGPPGYAVKEIHPLLYAAFSWFMLVSLVFALLSDRLSSAPVDESRYDDRAGSLILPLIAVLWVLLGAVLWLQLGPQLFLQSKRGLMDSGSSILAPFNHLSALLLLLLLPKGNARSLIAFSLIGLLTIAIGFRAPLALAIVGFSLLHFRRLGRISILRKYRLNFFVVTLLLIAGGVLAKPLYSSIKTFGLSGTVQLTKNYSVTEMLVLGSEFLRTQYMFNEIVVKDFRTDGLHLLRAPLSLLPIPRQLYTAPSSEFNDAYQDVLFPDVKGGLAYTPFGEAFAALGVLGLVCFALAYNFALILLNTALSRPRLRVALPLLAITAALLAFYIHRNSLAVSLGFMRLYLWPYLFAVVTSAWLYRSAAKAKSSLMTASAGEA